MALSRNASIDHWKFLSWHFQTATSEIPHQDDTKGTKPHPHVCCLNKPVPVRERIDHHEHFSTFTLVSSQHCHAGRFPWGYMGVSPVLIHVIVGFSVNSASCWGTHMPMETFILHQGTSLVSCLFPYLLGTLRVPIPENFGMLWIFLSPFGKCHAYHLR